MACGQVGKEAQALEPSVTARFFEQLQANHSISRCKFSRRRVKTWAGGKTPTKFYKLRILSGESLLESFPC